MFVKSQIQCDTRTMGLTNKKQVNFLYVYFVESHLGNSVKLENFACSSWNNFCRILALKFRSDYSHRNRIRINRGYEQDKHFCIFWLVRSHDEDGIWRNTRTMKTIKWSNWSGHGNSFIKIMLLDWKALPVIKQKVTHLSVRPTDQWNFSSPACLDFFSGSTTRMGPRVRSSLAPENVGFE